MFVHAARMRVLVALLSIASLAMICAAAAQALVNGRNATAVDIGQGGRKLGELRQVSARQWVETNAAGAATFRFEETQRDEWSVYLVDRTRNVTLQLDLHTRKVMYSDAGSPRRAIYDILAASAQPPAAATAQPGISSPVSAPRPPVQAAPQPAPAASPPPVSRAPAAAPPPPSTAAVAQRAIFGDSDPDICWKESYGRGAGQVPDACPGGFERLGADLLCYPVCRAGFAGVGPVCWQGCPAGFRDDGAFCAKPAAYGRGVGFAYAPLIESRDTARERCEREHGAGNCERNLEMYYPVCKAGFREAGSNLCTPVCPAGMTDIGISCAKQSYAVEWARVRRAKSACSRTSRVACAIPSAAPARPAWVRSAGAAALLRIRSIAVRRAACPRRRAPTRSWNRSSRRPMSY
ncbi:MAG TPA: hypothetical protein VED01_26725 [Burkholderiales bacterium]|nr:hypothetical protein [Burkholderiales bacterium]